MSNEYCCNCVYGGPSGSSVWCSRWSEWKGKYDSCRDFRPARGPSRRPWLVTFLLSLLAIRL
jgi:hypothetical protein